MSPTPQAFIDKWQAATLNEKATAQEHFIDLCRLLGLPTPNEADPKGQFFRFEKPLTKSGGSAGFADVWYRDRFAWEYKTKGKYADLRAAYQQLLLYKEDLDNPPILVACDIASYEVHVAFTGYRTVVERFANADLANASVRALLRQVFTDPEQLRPRERAETITERHGDGEQGGRPTYNNTTCFETYPFPWPPGGEPAGDPRVEAIAQAARDLVALRDSWLAGEASSTGQNAANAAAQPSAFSLQNAP